MSDNQIGIMEPKPASLFGLPQELFDHAIDITAVGEPTDGKKTHLHVYEAYSRYKWLLGAVSTNKSLRAAIQHAFFTSHIFDFECMWFDQTQLDMLSIAKFRTSRRCPIIFAPDWAACIPGIPLSDKQAIEVLPTSTMRLIKHAKIEVQWRPFDGFLWPIGEFKKLGVDELQSLHVEVRASFLSTDEVKELVTIEKDEELDHKDKGILADSIHHHTVVTSMVEREVKKVGMKVHELSITFA